MAITWGAEVKNSSGNGMRLGYELSQSPATVGTSTSSVTVTLKVYFWSRQSVFDSTNSYSISGDFDASGSANISHGSGGDTTLIRTLTRTVSTSYSSTVKSDFSASITGINAISGTARVSGSFTTAKRPLSKPAPVSGVSASRTSDTRQVVTWTRHSSTSAPYESIYVDRWDNVKNSWYNIASISGGSTSYTDSSTVANRRYRYRVLPRNSAGNSETHVYSSYLTTTQTPPTSVKASKVGGNILVAWTNKSTAADAVEVWHASDGVWEGTRLALLTGTPSSWVHASPSPGVTHAYKLKARSSEPTIYSPFGSTSNVVQLMGPPAAPSNLSPSSIALDATDDLTFLWRHNPIDATPQTAYEVQYRVNGGSWVTTGKVTTSAESQTFTAGTFTNGDVVEWQVRTWGEYATAPAYSAWSSMAVLTLSARPAGTIVSPGPDVNSSRIEVEWIFFDSEDTTQTSYRLRLEDATGDEVWAGAFNGTVSSHLIPYTVADAATYTVYLSVRDGDGVWSYESSQTFLVSWADPPAPAIALRWDVELGAVTVEIEHPEPAEDEVPVDHAEVWRSANGDEWVLIADNVEASTTITDFLPALNSVNYYRVVSVSTLPSSRESAAIPLVVDSEGWIYVNGSPNASGSFSSVLRVKYDPSVDVVLGREKVRHHFAGREKPVEFTGESVNVKINLSSVLMDDSSTREDVEAFAFFPAPLCYRDPDGRRVFVGIDPMSVGYNPKWHSVSMSFEQVDFNE